MSENLTILNDFISIAVPDKAESVTEKTFCNGLNAFASNEFGSLAGVGEIYEEFGHNLTSTRRAHPHRHGR